MASYNRRDAICSRCFSEERHRALRLYLDDLLRGLGRPLTILHFAPEYSMRQWLGKLPGITYLPVDFSPRSDINVRLDMTALGLWDGSVDLAIASHVLEHVPNDLAAVRELSRILRPGGFAVVMVPLDTSRQDTFEDPAIVTPQERAVAYWQFDHMRLYGRDFPKRLASCGLNVALIRPSERLDASAARRFGLSCDPAALIGRPIAPPDEIYIATKERGDRKPQPVRS
jgi:SAM-dependent methyltransferase